MKLWGASTAAVDETERTDAPPRDAVWRPEPVVVRRATREAEGVTTYELEFVQRRRNLEYRFQPGQFNMLYVPGVGEAAISVSGNAELPQRIAHTVRIAGRVTQALANMRSGDALGLRGPFGAGWPLSECVGRDVVIAAGGLGLAPLRPALERLLTLRQPLTRIYLVYGARAPGNLLYSRDYDRWIGQGVNVYTIVDRADPGWLGQVGVATVLWEQLSGFDPQNAVVFCCGPEAMIRATVKTAQREGVRADRIWVSLERHMQCAAGLCGHCQLGPLFVCRDGPVFRYDRVKRYLETEDV
ncbi:MAG: FAD/NAD(P)-binding protein [Planctomycetales bacterium]|nr:FAD/NAD(P)-binding protein [Planctomycetales bacterium]